MNREEIVRMAREAGIANSWDLNWQDKIIERFAYLVAQQERKECEKIIWDADDWIGSDAKIWIVKSIQEARATI